LKIIDIGRFALSFYEKYGGLGVRVYVDPQKLEPFPEIKKWFFKLIPKMEQDRDLLMEEVQKAGFTVCSFEEVRLDPDFINAGGRKGFTLCPLCHEAYPTEHGPLCGGCQGQLPYIQQSKVSSSSISRRPQLKALPVEEAAGKHALHDMTQIIPGQEKGPAFKRNQVISAGDICRLQRMGRQSIYVSELSPEDSDWVHEDEAAKAFAQAMAGEGVTYSEHPS
jgi:formylmethanofuran dehydrogenase subunit E